MKLEQLLKLIGGPSMLDDRVEQLSGESDELITDETLVIWLNEAQRRLCREAWVLEDTVSPECCEVPLVENKTDYVLHPSVLGVKYMRLSDSDVDLLRVGYEDNRIHPTSAAYDPEFWDVNVASLESAGRPTRWSADVGTKMIRVRAKPDESASALKLKMAVVRMPLKELDEKKLSVEPEIPAEFHLDLADFAAGKACSGANVDADMQRKGAAWLRSFEDRIKAAARTRRRFQQSQPQFRPRGWGSGDR